MTSADNAVCYINKGISAAVLDHSGALGNSLNRVPLKNNPCLYLRRYKLNIQRQQMKKHEHLLTSSCLVGRGGKSSQAKVLQL